MKSVTLPSGLKATIRGFDVKHQRNFTAQGKYHPNEALTIMLADCVTDIGERKIARLPENERTDIMEALLEQDRTALLYYIRLETFDDEFIDVEVERTVFNRKTKETVTVSINNIAALKKGYCQNLKRNAKGYFTEGETVTISTLDELPKFKQRIVCFNDKRFRFHLLDGRRSNWLASQSNIDAFTGIEARQPEIEITKNKKGEPLKEPIWLKLNLSDNERITTKEVEILRSAIVAAEAIFDTKVDGVDIMASLSFFFPSGAL